MPPPSLTTFIVRDLPYCIWLTKKEIVKLYEAVGGKCHGNSVQVALYRLHTEGRIVRAKRSRKDHLGNYFIVYHYMRKVRFYEKCRKDVK